MSRGEYRQVGGFGIVFPRREAADLGRFSPPKPTRDLQSVGGYLLQEQQNSTTCAEPHVLPGDIDPYHMDLRKIRRQCGPTRPGAPRTLAPFKHPCNNEVKT